MASYVYIMANEGQPELVKIGYTYKHPKERALELDSTGLAHPLTVAYYAEVGCAEVVEKAAHQLLKAVRVRKGREWFRCDMLDGIAAIREAAQGNIVAEYNAEAERAELARRVQAERERQERERREYEERQERERREYEERKRQEQEERERQREQREQEAERERQRQEAEWLREREEREERKRRAALQREQDWKEVKAALKRVVVTLVAILGTGYGVVGLIELVSPEVEAPQPQPQMTMPQSQSQVEEWSPSYYQRRQVVTPQPQVAAPQPQPQMPKAVVTKPKTEVVKQTRSETEEEFRKRRQAEWKAMAAEWEQRTQSKLQDQTTKERRYQRPTVEEAEVRVEKLKVIKLHPTAEERRWIEVKQPTSYRRLTAEEARNHVPYVIGE